MKLISWNVNGLRACIQKGFLEQFQSLDADFFCLQETKLQEGQITLELPGYEQYWCYAEKKGYSGTAIFTKHTPLSVSYGIGVPELDNEGRVITLEYPEFYLVNCYTPNAQRGLARLEHRMKWDDAYRSYITSLDAKKPTILCGDLNVAHQEIDLKNPASNRGNAGFSDEERSSFTKTLSLGFTDTFRYLHPDATGAYSWWSYMYHARENNAGWRIDYFLVSDRIRSKIYHTPIYNDIFGSDHCPVGLELDITCNGSIWMETQSDKPKVILPEKKPVSKSGKVLLVLAVVLIITGLGSFAVRLLPVSKQDYLIVHHYDQPLTTTIQTPINLASFYYGLTDGETTWILNSKLDSSSYSSHLDPLFLSIYPLKNSEKPNCWLRLELTDQALESYDDSWSLSFTASMKQGEDTSITSDSTCQLNSFPYFLSNDSTQIGGWFLLGYLPGEANLIFTLNTGEESVSFQVDAVPISSDYSRNEAKKLVTQALVYKIVNDFTIYSQLNRAVLNEHSGDIYQQAVSENAYLAELETRYDACGYLLQWFGSGSDPQRTTAYVLLSQDIYRRSMGNQKEQTFLRLEESMFSLQKQIAATLPTDILLSYILGLRNLGYTLIGYYEPVPYYQLEQEFPALSELAQRSDVIDTLMNAENLGEVEMLTINQLLDNYRNKMTVEEEASYLLCQYPSYYTKGSPVSFSLPAQNASTEEMIRAIFLDSGLGKLLLYASNDAVRKEIFFRSTQGIDVIDEVIHRGDFIETLFSLVEPNIISQEMMMLRCAMRLTLIQEQMTPEQLIFYKENYIEVFDIILYG